MKKLKPPTSTGDVIPAAMKKLATPTPVSKQFLVIFFMKSLGYPEDKAKRLAGL